MSTLVTVFIYSSNGRAKCGSQANTGERLPNWRNELIYWNFYFPASTLERAYAESTTIGLSKNSI
jgi:hypothetical protein